MYYSVFHKDNSETKKVSTCITEEHALEDIAAGERKNSSYDI